MKYLVFCLGGSVVGVLYMLISNFSNSYDTAQEIRDNCKPTNFYSIDATTVTRVYDCSEALKQ